MLFALILLTIAAALVNWSPSMFTVLRKVDNATDPRRSRIHSVANLRNGEKYSVKTHTIVRNLRTGKLASSRPIL